MSIKINSKILNELVSEQKLAILKKPQKKAGNINYFITPSLCLELYNAKVVFSTPSYIVFEFDKVQHVNLLSMLQSIDKQLQYYLRTSFHIDNEQVQIHQIYFDKESTFTIRCSLPSFGRHPSIKYLVYADVNGEDCPFKVPRNNIILTKISVDIRNFWESQSRIGYNLELKRVSY